MMKVALLSILFLGVAAKVADKKLVRSAKRASVEMTASGDLKVDNLVDDSPAIDADTSVSSDPSRPKGQKGGQKGGSKGKRGGKGDKKLLIDSSDDSDADDSDGDDNDGDDEGASLVDDSPAIDADTSVSSDPSRPKGQKGGQKGGSKGKRGGKGDKKLLFNSSGDSDTDDSDGDDSDGDDEGVSLFRSGSFIHRMHGRLSASCSSTSDCEGTAKVRNKCKSRCNSRRGYSPSDACGDDCDEGQVCCTKRKETPICCVKTRDDGSTKQKCKRKCKGGWKEVSDEDDDEDDDEFFEDEDDE